MSDDELNMASVSPSPKPVVGWYSSLGRNALQTVFLGIIAGVLILAALDAACFARSPSRPRSDGWNAAGPRYRFARPWSSVG